MAIFEEGLECPLCLDLAADAVESKCECHIIYCKDCASKLDKCPLCRTAPFKFQPNIPIRRQIEALPVDCQYCNSKVRRDDIILHEKNCDKRPRKCRFQNCNYSSSDPEKVFEHLKRKHLEDVYMYYEAFSSTPNMSIENGQLRTKVQNFKKENRQLAEQLTASKTQLENLNEKLQQANAKYEQLLKATNLNQDQGIPSNKRRRIDGAETFSPVATAEQNLNLVSPNFGPTGQDEWRFLRAGDALKIYNTGKLAWRLRNDASAKGAQTQCVEAEGTSTFRVRVESTFVFVGVAYKTECLENLWQNGNSWMLWLRTGEIFRRHNISTLRGSSTAKFTPGSLITAELESRTRSLRFYVNGEQYGDVVELGIRKREYKQLCFVVDFSKGGNKAEIIDS